MMEAELPKPHETLLHVTVLRQGSQAKFHGTLIGIMELAPTREGVMKIRLMVRRAELPAQIEVLELGTTKEFPGAVEIAFLGASEPDEFGVRSAQLRMRDLSGDAK